MLLVPELSKFTPGVKRATSEKSLMPRRSRLSCVSAVTLIGTLVRLSSRRVAVSVTSCSGPAVSGAWAWACDWQQDMQYSIRIYVYGASASGRPTPQAPEGLHSL